MSYTDEKAKTAKQACTPCANYHRLRLRAGARVGCCDVCKTSGVRVRDVQREGN